MTATRGGYAKFRYELQDQGVRVTVRPIRLFGDPVLRTRAGEVVDFDGKLRTLVRELWDTMEKRGGAGLAAPQLGVGARAFTYHCDGQAGHLINPSLWLADERTQDGMEGCLSIPELDRKCRRYRNVVARGWNMHGEPVEVSGSDLLARCLQHETDHLNGVLFLDRLDERSRETALSEIRAASWFGGTEPVIEQDPHSLFR